MKIKDNEQYETTQFLSLHLGDVFVSVGNVYMVCEEGLDSVGHPCNAVNLESGELTYFDNRKLVICHSNATLNLNA